MSIWTKKKNLGDLERQTVETICHIFSKLTITLSKTINGTTLISPRANQQIKVVVSSQCLNGPHLHYDRSLLYCVFGSFPRATWSFIISQWTPLATPLLR